MASRLRAIPPMFEVPYPDAYGVAQASPVILMTASAPLILCYAWIPPLERGGSNEVTWKA